MAWVAGLVIAASALQWAGSGSLAPPPVLDPGQWAAWLDGRDPVVAAFSLLRMAALAGLWYVAVVSSVGALLRLVGAAALVRIADRFTIGPVRRLLAGSVSLGLAASGVVAVAMPAVRAPVAAQTAPSPSTTSTTRLPPATVTMHRLGPTEGVPPRALPQSPEVAGATVTAAGQWTVKPGECFWSIAESVLADRWGRAPTDAEIVPFWRRLIQANRHELAQRDNPDLVFPGQSFIVPAP